MHFAIRTLFIGFHTLSLFAFSSCASSPVLAASAPERYQLPTSSTKLVDNRGEGFENLYGVRNFRAVLGNLLYRGGGNNKYNRYGARANRNPLPMIGLENLCKEGFSTAVYMYSDGYAEAPKSVDCTLRKTGAPNTLEYLQISPYNPASVRELLERVHRKVREESDPARISPLYYHCWNGWHASGLISAFALRQFCGYSPEEAIQYWDLNTDGNHTDPNFEKLRQQIRDFQPYYDLSFDPNQQKKYCLPLAKQRPNP